MARSAGPSFRYKDQTANEIIRQGFPVTLAYGAWSFAAAVPVGVSPGVAEAVYRNTFLDCLAVGVSIGARVLPRSSMNRASETFTLPSLSASNRQLDKSTEPPGPRCRKGFRARTDCAPPRTRATPCERSCQAPEQSDRRGENPS